VGITLAALNQTSMHENSHLNTKIVATVGPSSSSYEMLYRLVEEGVDVFRLNLSHSDHAFHKKIIENITHINEKHNLHVGILADLQGPKIRIGLIENDSMPIKPGDILTFVPDEVKGNRERIQINYRNFAKDVNIGERVLLDDGKIICEVVETNKKDNVKLKVIFGSVLSSRKGVNLPQTKISLPSMTKKDLNDLAFVLTQPVNWIALSFVRSAKDVKNLRRLIEEKGHPAKVISKIEKPEAVEKIDKIVQQSDGIMIARGDLGIEVPMEKLPAIQKGIIYKCIQWGKPVIVATQLMDSMITNPSPTRAEITDVANAVLDGTDALMLSGETSIGCHPEKVVHAMKRIIREAEFHYALGKGRPEPDPTSSTFLSDVVCFNSGKTAEDIRAKGIVGLTSSGYTAFKISSFRPNCNIYVFSDKEHTLTTLNLVWGVRCFYYDKFTTTDETIADTITILRKHGLVKKGDYVINTGSMPLEDRHRTNFLKISLVE
jgi:pyruvate kinase